MLQARKSFLLLAVWFLLLGLPIFADSLSYDMATGTLSGFNIGSNDSPYTPGSRCIQQPVLFHLCEEQRAV